MELVRLTVVPNEVEAEVLQSLLQTEGIQSVQRQTDFGAGATGGFGIGGAREILVRQEDLETARALIAES